HMHILLVRSAEVPGDAQNMLEISSKRDVPTICVEGRLEVSELISAKDFDSLASGGQREQAEDHGQQQRRPHQSSWVAHRLFSWLLSKSMDVGGWFLATRNIRWRR